MSPKVKLKKLKEQAAELGIKHSNNISVTKLEEKINEFLGSNNTQTEYSELETVEELVTEPVTQNDITPVVEEKNEVSMQQPSIQYTQPKVQKSLEEIKAEEIAKKRKEIWKLTRCIVSNLDPKDSDLDGGHIGFSSRLLGRQKKWIPYTPERSGVNGYYIPQGILNQMKDMKFRKTIKKFNAQTNQEYYEHVWSPKFSIQELPSNTKEELKELARSQTARNVIDNSNSL